MASTVATVLMPLTIALLAPAVGPLVADALDDTEPSLTLVVAGGLWGLWAIALVASLVARSLSLTALRVLVPVSVPVAAWAALAGDPGTVVAALGVGAATAASAVALSSIVGDRWVDGSSYGDERRFCLRPPTVLLLGPLELIWLLTVVGAAAGPLLLAAGSWVAGAIAWPLGWAAAWIGARSMHRLARRWLVFVPAGVVIHDDMAIADVVMIPKGRMAAIGPAPADSVSSGALDLTLGALGLALRLRFDPALDLLTQADRRAEGITARSRSTTRVLVAPTRPGRVLDEAERRRLPLG
jgi:hypothetical protein